jgi:hypothetical protein
MPAQQNPPPADPPAEQKSAEGIAFDGLLPAAAVDHIKAVEKEYGTWVAIQPIPMGNALAFAVGAQVPISHVERFQLDKQGLVAKANTKAARAAQGLEEE